MEMYEHFQEAAESILEQTYDDVELVVVVDGTLEVYDRVVADYSNRDDVIIDLNDENLGLLESRNKGAKLASGDIVAFIDDDAVADKNWVEELVGVYDEEAVIAAGGKMTPIWVNSKPSFLPEEFYWLIGVTHRGFGGEGEVRNTFGSNLSFIREAFLKLGGFNTDIGGRKEDKNLQGGETELCARLRSNLDGSVYYNPDAKVGHKVFNYRTRFNWLLKRAFWQGYSKRAMEVLVSETGDEESEYLGQILFEFMPDRLRKAVSEGSVTEGKKFVALGIFTASVGLGYLYGLTKWN